MIYIGVWGFLGEEDGGDVGDGGGDISGDWDIFLFCEGVDWRVGVCLGDVSFGGF